VTRSGRISMPPRQAIRSVRIAEAAIRRRTFCSDDETFGMSRLRPCDRFAASRRTSGRSDSTNLGTSVREAYVFHRSAGHRPSSISTGISPGYRTAISSVAPSARPWRDCTDAGAWRSPQGLKGSQKQILLPPGPSFVQVQA
jgi:hypothetical protein